MEDFSMIGKTVSYYRIIEKSGGGLDRLLCETAAYSDYT
jgi:hypothetical protein